MPWIGKPVCLRHLTMQSPSLTSLGLVVGNTTWNQVLFSKTLCARDDARYACWWYRLLTSVGQKARPEQRHSGLPRTTRGIPAQAQRLPLTLGRKASWKLTRSSRCLVSEVLAFPGRSCRSRRQARSCWLRAESVTFVNSHMQGLEHSSEENHRFDITQSLQRQSR